MENKNNPYNQGQPSGPMMPPQMPPINNGVKGKAYGVRAMKNVFPKWVTQYGVVAYLLALAIVTFMYSAYSLPWYYMLSGLTAMVVFFFYGSYLTERTLQAKMRKVGTFEQRIFILSLIVRVLWMFLLYTIFKQNYGDAFGYENADPTYYDDLGRLCAGLIDRGNFSFYDEIVRWNGGRGDLSDMGYGIYMGFVYWITGSIGPTDLFAMQPINGSVIETNAVSIIIMRLLKCLLSAITVLLIYRLAKRNFGEQTGRVAAIFCALWPNFWYYCGTHLKETEMVFLAVLFVEQADQMLRSRQFTAWKVIPVLLIASALLTFRTPLALVAFLSLIFSVVMSSTKVVSWGKRIIVGVLAILLIGVTMGSRIEDETRGLLDTVQQDQQRTNMEWRSQRDNGNAFAKYAGKSVFAPLIFTIPFPTMVRPFDGQEVQQLLNGGNFIKNIISAFTIFAMFMLLMTGKWREHLLPLSFMLGYLVVLTMSTFAQSERFHQPAMPFELMFAAYGLSVAVTKPKYKRWFTYWVGLMFVACVVWNWFKIAGRGLG